MWVVSISHQQKLMHVWTRGFNKHLPLSTLGSQLTSYHVASALLFPKDNSMDPVVRKKRKVPNTSFIEHKTVKSKGWQNRNSSVPSTAWEKEMPAIQRPNCKTGDDSRVSCELRKLCLEDFPAERERQVRQAILDPRAEKYEFVFGIAPCLLALTQARRKAHKLFVKDGETFHRASVLKVCEEANRRGIQVHRVNKKSLDQMSSGRVHQGVCLQASPLDYLTENSDSLSKRKEVKGKSTPLWLVLEGIQDPMNLGAILRSAYFLGVDRVASSLHYSCPLSPVVSKASSGVMEVMGVYGYENLEDMLRLRMAEGWQVVGTVGTEAEESQIPVTKCSDFQMTQPMLLLIGSEGEGLSKDLLSLCQTLLTIPARRELCPGIESLNVSVATGILLHSVLFSKR